MADGLDYPAGLFELLRKRLAFKKGALLLPDGAELLVPWACSGFDMTTLRRLHIPAELILSGLEGKTKPVQVVEGQGLNALSPYLSSREYGLMKRLALCVFLGQERVLGLFLMSDGPYLQRIGPLRLMLAALAASVPPRLFSARSEKIRKSLEVSAENRDVFLNRLEDLFLLAPDRGMNFYCGRLPLTGLLASFARTAPHVDPYRIGQDIITLIGTLLGGSALFHDSEKKTLYFGGLVSFDHPELLVHQLESTLKDFFHDLSQLADFGFTMFAFPEDGNSFDELTGKLFG